MINARFRNSHQLCSFKKSALKNFAKFTGKNTCARVSFLIKLQPEAYHHCGACGDRKNV